MNRRPHPFIILTVLRAVQSHIYYKSNDTCEAEKTTLLTSSLHNTYSLWVNEHIFIVRVWKPTIHIHLWLHSQTVHKQKFICWWISILEWDWLISAVTFGCDICRSVVSQGGALLSLHHTLLGAEIKHFALLSSSRHLFEMISQISTFINFLCSYRHGVVMQTVFNI